MKYVGILGSGIGLGMIAGPAVGGILSGLYGYVAPSFLASAFAFSNFVAAYFRLPEPSVRSDHGESSRVGLAPLLETFRRQAFVFLLPT